jgi:hypothetical protein
MHGLLRLRVALFAAKTRRSWRPFAREFLPSAALSLPRAPIAATIRLRRVASRTPGSCLSALATDALKESFYSSLTAE